MNAAVLEDQRLTTHARLLAGVLVGLAGRERFADVTRGYLAVRLGVSVRTISRAIRDLRAFGYVATCHLLGERGETMGLRIEILEPLLPFWEGVTDTPPLESQNLN